MKVIHHWQKWKSASDIGVSRDKWRFPLFFFRIIPDKSEAKLIPIYQKMDYHQANNKSIIITDGWASYKSLNNLDIIIQLNCIIEDSYWNLADVSKVPHLLVMIIFSICELNNFIIYFFRFIFLSMVFYSLSSIWMILYA